MTTTIKDFPEMTADELATYSGDVHTYRCVLEHRKSGAHVPHDFQGPTKELALKHLGEAIRHLGPIVSRTYHVALACCRQTIKSRDFEEGAGGAKLCRHCGKQLATLR